MYSLSITGSVFFWGQISPDFDLKNMISTYTKDFPWEKWAKFAKKKIPNSKSLDFYAKFQEVAKDIKRIVNFIYSYLLCSQIWLKSSYR